MTSTLIYVLIATSLLLCIVGVLYVDSLRRLRKYRAISDAEEYRSQCESKARAALEHCSALTTKNSSLLQLIANHKQKVAKYQELLGTFQSIADLKTRIDADEARARKLKESLGLLDEAVQLDVLMRSLESSIGERRQELEALTDVLGAARSCSEIASQAVYYQNLLAQLKADVEEVEEAKELQTFGFYRARFEFDSSAMYQNRLDDVRARQKSALSTKTACICNTEWTVDGSKTEGRKMVNQQIKLMLRAFNGECDAAVSKVRFNNVASLEKRLRRSYDDITKLGEAKKIYLAQEYLNLKLEELYLAHELQQKREEERETQRLIREQMREEQKVAKEIERLQEEAEEEEEIKAAALERARRELAEATGFQTAKLESLVSRLECELKDALDKKAKAIARAQLTKSGHVYILSNIGAFGEGVFKIGMSRRLEPLDRVDELGGASVPFPFDVHAMIYSENAPELECSLHQRFAHRRVNLVNLRREFFRVTLDEIRAAVAEEFGQVTFELVPKAEQYRLTIAKLSDLAKTQLPLQIA
ncbi:MAG: DUF4041 domain-containing protein [Planctomycetales bacterium]|nr:DUF4041 domain-containing protein [Planctomycetales bacterium]MBN8629044.1 DUF4041 domain-containing protein [Planctomycetota bacterium]